MYAAERQQRILEHAQGEGRVEVATLADRFDVTTETVRRDLAVLEQQGLVRRVHGGALPTDRPVPELSLSSRIGRQADAKLRIATRALAELPEDGTVLLDSGSTTLALAELIPTDARLTVVTNNATIAAALAGRENLTLLLIGGRVRTVTAAAVGPWATAALAGLTVDVAFLGTNGFDAAHGLTTPDQDEAAVKRAMLDAARTRVLLADSSKLGAVHLQRFARTDELHTVITDTDADDDAVDALRSAGPKVVTA
ncbi:D-beta-D-heptose 1-phosphate adenosyltransferase [Microbacterium mangrovi]|uniref:Lactose phosphotransferase system repressor n=1 Tax=Microbacterium mangrovi TaxID=1348253 RepID=A0A0B2A9I7_9MICO|nr:DeoR/GlpR family DNA-binding transcription regulator [Microbacterium mangrovi]KHK98266.1 D-beta-D-heptose 1-phosphate adenosyltransferase [Microbacterium mangrovi]